MKSIVTTSVLFLTLYGLLSCAKVGNITGGPKDTTPPKMDTLHSTPNFQTNFTPKEISIRFDEWIKLKAPFNNIVISPPLSKKYTVTNKGKRVLLRFDPEEEWKPNTTYIIQFGSSIVDLNEGNPAKELMYVFSTGNSIDSLSLSGVVTDGLTGQVVKDALVMLYDRRQDSLPLLEKPYYFAKTDAGGHFSMGYLKRDTFMLFVLQDENRNYKYDLEKEKIGFVDSALILRDSFPPLLLTLFLPRPKWRITDQKTGDRMMKLVFSAPPQGVEIHPLDSIALSTWTDRDSLFILLPDGWKDTININVRCDGNTLDTVRYIPGSKEILSPSKIKITNIEAVPEGESKGWNITFNQVLLSNREFMQLWKDSTLLNDTVWSISPMASSIQWSVHYPWSSGHHYVWKVLPGGFKMRRDSILKDTLITALPVVDAEKTSRLALKLVHPPKGERLLLQLMDGETAVRSSCVQVVDSALQLTWSYLPPKAYTLRITEDENDNCRWDSGDWWSKKQPESVRIKKIEQLRANWDTEVVIDWSK